MKDLKEEVIKFSQKLNSTNLSPLRSGNVSVRTTSDGIEGFLITPSGKKYETLKVEDIVFLELNKEYDFLKIFNSGLNPSSEWRFHQDIYLKKKEAKAIVHAHSPNATAVFSSWKNNSSISLYDSSSRWRQYKMRRIWNFWNKRAV